MNNQDFQIRVPDLTRLDQLSLEKQLDSSQLHFEQAPDTAGTHGELATATAIVIVSLSALRVLAAWLTKRRKQKSSKVTLEVTDPQGNRRTLVVEFGDQESTTEPEILKQLAAACNVDISSLVKL